MLGQEIDLMRNYPKTKRNLSLRAEKKSEADKELAREYGKDFFDGDRKHGYGGLSYLPRFWQPVIPDFQEHFKLTKESKVLDVGCAKGFMLFDMQQLLPGISVTGLDISTYAIANAKEEVKPFLQVGNAIKLPYPDNSFDVVISITTLHNLEREELAMALKEIERVSTKGSFITVDAYHNDDEKQRLEDWVLTAKKMMHVDEWKVFFQQVGYTGDYFWFTP
jgi:SAM-dependent methyltransferase